MKKILFGMTILAILSLLVACSVGSKSSTKSGSSAGTASLSEEGQLLVGTFKLEDTEQAITADQAKQLLPLWQTLQTLSTSSTAASEEISAVVDQIKSNMTAQQLDKITAMKLTQPDMLSIMSQAGFSPNSANATTTPMSLNGFQGNGNPQSGGSGPGGSGPGGGPGGAPPSGGGMPSGGDPNMMGGAVGASSTPQAGRPNGISNQVPQPLYSALIDMLEKKIK